MLITLSKFTPIQYTPTSPFTNLDVNYFPSDTYTYCDINVDSSSELQTPYDVTSSFGDDVLVVDITHPTIELPQRVRNPYSYLRDYHCYSNMLHYHEPQSYEEELQTLEKNIHKTLLILLLIICL